jgi:hypothetical protein
MKKASSIKHLTFEESSLSKKCSLHISLSTLMSLFDQMSCFLCVSIKVAKHMVFMRGKTTRWRERQVGNDGVTVWRLKTWGAVLSRHSYQLASLFSKK